MAILVAAHVSAMLLEAHGIKSHRISRLLDVDQEANLPSWFSAMILMGSALVSAAVTVRTKSLGQKGWLPWAGLAAIFVYLSCDEAAMLHDFFMRVGGIGGRWVWVLPAVVLAGTVAIVYLRFVWQFPWSQRILIFLSGGLYVVGAAGGEILGGMVIDHGWKIDVGGISTYRLFATVEETSEMMGVIVWIYVQLNYLSSLPGDGALQISFGRATASPAPEPAPVPADSVS